jgi:hypothetical protein
MERVLIVLCLAGAFWACADGNETSNANPDSTTNQAPSPGYNADTNKLNDTSMKDTTKLPRDTM